MGIADEPRPISLIDGFGLGLGPSVAADIAQKSDTSALDAVKTLLRYIGEDPDRPGLQDTPQRVLKAWRESWGSGYKEVHPSALIKLFTDHREDYGSADPALEDQMIMVGGIQFWSHCEHHMAPFFGEAVVAYIPDARGVIGLSKLARVVDYFARRLQVQERLTGQIASFLTHHLSVDVAVLVKAKHLCMASRGATQPHAITTTSAVRGVFFHDAKARAEFFSQARGSSSFACD